MKKLALAAAFLAPTAAMLPTPAHAQFAQPGTFAQPGGTATVQTNGTGTVTGGTATVFASDGNGVYANGGAQVRPDGNLYAPVQTVNINNSGCSRNLGNALACIGAQTFGQILVNRSAVREQRDATIVVERARFTLGQDAGGYGSPAPAGPAMVQCTLTLNGQTQTLRMSQADCEAEAARLGTTAQRR